MLVTDKNIDEVLNILSKQDWVALDTETTGLNWHQNDRIFCVIVGNDTEQYFFDFKNGVDKSIIRALSENICNIFMHNAKFDMAFLRKENFEFKGFVHCTMAMERLLRNDKFNYSLSSLGSEIGFEKSDAVKEYCLKHKLYDVTVPLGKKTKQKNFQFDKVPLEIIMPYGKRDVEITYKLGVNQRCQFTKMNYN